MSLGYDQRLYILACDHRGSFQKKLMGIAGQPTAEEAARISDAKAVIFEGMMKALAEGTSRESAGILIDEQFGADIARKAKAEGLRLAMPIEKSGQDEFDFEYGDEFGAHIEEFDPDFNKVLVRYNPEGDPGMNERQTARLKRLSDWLHAHDRKFLFELLVPPEPSQLEAVGDNDRYDAEVRPGLMLVTIRTLQNAGVEPDIWKIEGIDSREDCQRIATQVRSGPGRERVSCVVLGRGANDEKVHHWLRMGAGVLGYIGFAIGRTIWWDALKGYLDGSLSRDQAAAQISAKYRENIEVYESAAAGN